MEHQTKREEIIAMVASVIGIAAIVIGLGIVGGVATSCSANDLSVFSSHCIMSMRSLMFVKLFMIYIFIGY